MEKGVTTPGCPYTLMNSKFVKKSKNLKLWDIKHEQTLDDLAKFQLKITFEEPSPKKTKSLLKMYIDFEQ